jgi:dihydropteroate synthase
MDRHPASSPLAAPGLTVRGRTLAWGERTYVMGIVNVTPDSFSGDGLLTSSLGRLALQTIISQALRQQAEGADILDVGGESTRPGSIPVSADVEIDRVVPTIRALRAETDVPISIDTSKAAVVSAALEAGADIVNDVWGLRLDPDLPQVVAASGAPVIIMHNRSRPKDAQQEQRLGGRYVGVVYQDLIGDIAAELAEQVALAREAGIAPERIIIDPGIGFGKTVSQNLELMRRLGELRSLGLPLLIGPSRKSFIGYTLDLPPEERIEGTLAAIGVAMMQGAANIVRVHDVAPAVRFCRMLDAILHA